MGEPSVSLCCEAYRFGNPVHGLLVGFDILVDGVVDCEEDGFKFKSWGVRVFEHGVRYELCFRERDFEIDCADGVRARVAWETGCERRDG